MLHKTQCVPGFGDWIDSILEFSQALHRMKLDVSSFACLTALVIIAGECLELFRRPVSEWNSRAELILMRFLPQIGTA